MNGIVKASWLLLFPFIVAGCVSLTTQQQQKLDEIQLLADRTTAIIWPTVCQDLGSARDQSQHRRVYRQGNIFLNVRMLDSPGLTKLVAHELGHYVLGHDSIIPQAVSQAEWERAQQQRELDANAKAVEILVRAQGLSENAALQMVVDALGGLRTRRREGLHSLRGTFPRVRSSRISWRAFRPPRRYLASAARGAGSSLSGIGTSLSIRCLLEVLPILLFPTEEQLVLYEPWMCPQARAATSGARLR